MIEVQLVHEAGVRFADGPALAEEGECGCGGVGGRGGRGRGEEVGDYGGCGAGFAHCAGRRSDEVCAVVMKMKKKRVRM